jgi:lysozyme
MAGKRRKKNNRNIAWFLLFVCILAAGWYLWKREAPHFFRYREFGIEIPSNYAIHGIDVSKYQSYIDWDQVKAMNVQEVQIGFAFMKATEGIANTDQYFKRNWRRAAEAHMIRGAYHFFISTKSGKAQAKNFIRNVELEPGDLPPVIDVEQTYGVNPVKLRKNVKEFLDAVENYYCVRPIIYTNVDFYNHYLSEEFDDYPLWVAHYLQKDHPRIERDWIFWQHSEEGRVNGILTKVDFNVFNGDSTDFRNLLVTNNSIDQQ